MRYPCEVSLSTLYFEGVNQHEGILCQQQLRLRNVRRQRKRIFSRYRALITLNFMSATQNKRRIFTRQRLAFNRSLIADLKRERERKRAMRFDRTILRWS